MIRLSCWIGGVGHRVFPETVADEAGPSVGFAVSSLKRGIFEDVLVKDSLDRVRFADRSEALALHFRRPLGAPGLSPSWQRFRSGLGLARDGAAGARTDDVRVPCLTD